MEVTKEQLYNMNLHEIITVSRGDCGSFNIIKVIGGWIYVFQFATNENSDMEVHERHVFVPDPVQAIFQG